MGEIDKGTRVANYLIDIFIISFIKLLITTAIPIYPDYVLFYFLMFLYYLVLESVWGQTIGKMITKTKVVHKNGKKPSFLNIFMRSFLRIIPYDAYSYLFGTEIGLHDLLSSTRLKKIEEL